MFLLFAFINHLKILLSVLLFAIYNNTDQTYSFGS
jgi:hypothetical protein